MMYLLFVSDSVDTLSQSNSDTPITISPAQEEETEKMPPYDQLPEYVTEEMIPCVLHSIVPCRANQ